MEEGQMSVLSGPGRPGHAFRGWRRRAAVAGGAAFMLLGPAAGMAGAAATGPVLGWSPSGTYGYGTLNAGQTASQTFTLDNSGSGATAALQITLSGSSA